MSSGVRSHTVPQADRVAVTLPPELLLAKTSVSFGLSVTVAEFHAAPKS